MTAARDRRRTWWLAFAVFGLGMGLWSLAMPLYGSPDEPAHVTKAAAVARGQLLGRDVDTSRGVFTHVKVPRALVSQLRPCYARVKKATPACQRLQTGSELVDAGTQAGHYQPLYYLLVGWPSLLAPNHLGLWLMRLAGVVLNAALLASALLSVRRRSPVIGPLALGVAVSPMVFFMSGGVNPSSLEITAAIGTWAALLALLSDPVGADRRLVVRLAVAASMFALSRSLSPLWVAVTAVVCLVWAGWRPVREVLRRRDAKICVAVVAVAGLVASAWIVLAGALDLRSTNKHPELNYAEAVLHAFRLTTHRVEAFVGWYGWLDTPSPSWTLFIWSVVAGMLIIAALALAGRWSAFTLSGLAVIVVVLPVLLEATHAATLGFVWQGRYTLPIAVGLPLLAARALQNRWSERIGDTAGTLFVARRVAIVSVALLMSAHLTAFIWALWRNVGGIQHDPYPFRVLWQPPLPFWLLILGFAVAVVLLGLLLIGPRPAVASSVGEDPAPVEHEVPRGGGGHDRELGDDVRDAQVGASRHDEHGEHEVR